MRRLAVLALSACAPAPSDAPASRALTMSDTLPLMRSFAPAAAPAPSRPNADIANDFLDLVFRMESGRTVPVMTRFEGPISVRVTGDAPPSLIADLRALLSRLQNEAGIDIFMTGAPDAAITIEAIPRATLNAAVPRAACFVVPRIDSWAAFREARRTPMVDWTTLTRRDRAAIFVPNDVAPQEIRDCLHEELAQALGPLNDLYRLSDSVFNDDNIHAVLTGFDMLVLRAYYAPELPNGTTRGQAAARLPAVLARLNPAGQRPGGSPINDTSRDWIDAIENALAGAATPAGRRQSAEMAINLARAFGWTGTRRGFGLYAYGRLQVSNDPDLALQAFLEAARTYRASPETRLHEAHVNVQLAAFALSSGDIAGVLRLTEDAIPIARGHENAALLATLLMFRAEALALSGQEAEAQSARLDSLAWARYGFGSERNVLARAREIAALVPDLGG
jgi:hypothetical protein